MRGACSVERAAIGLDIGGANLKAVHSGGIALSRPFALWREPLQLAPQLRQLRAALPPAGVLAVTMTGELCDCFESKRLGVAAILDAVETAAAGTPVYVWCNEGRFLDLVSARTMPLQTAAANWLALATFAGRFAPDGPALLIDIGSTTTDLIPLLDGKPMPLGRTDPERLRFGELIYTGVRRTPMCALLNEGVAAELFATALDVYLVLGRIADDSDDCNTADGRPATRAGAEARIARMLCADLETSTEDERQQLARRAADRQRELLERGLRQVLSRLPGPLQTVVLAGEGEFLALDSLGALRDLSAEAVVSLNHELGSARSQAACAHAVMVLATENCPAPVEGRRRRGL
jgi:probable H4MPT-linked C1 transfer pathway protein